MTAKLHINIAQGVLDIEGDESFVQTIYSDFKARLLDQLNPVNDTSKANPAVTKGKGPNEGADKASARGAVRAEGKAKASAQKIKANTSLDLSKLDGFYEQFEPSNNPEKILIFAMFLRNTLKMATCKAEDIYSCYFHFKDQMKIPEAFKKNISDTKTAGYIEGTTDALSITTVGENYFNHKLKRKGADK